MTQEKPRDQEYLGRTLRDDLLHGDLWGSLRRDYRDLREFYLDDYKKTRLAGMGRLKRSIYMTGWLIKILLLRLTPIRRLLLILGLILILFSGNIQWRGGSVSTNAETYIIGGILIVFLLMLELKDKLLARSELEAGRSVQYALLPPRKPAIPGWSVWIYSQPANEVGGDLIDYLKVNETRHGIAIGDIAGKGLRAALLMAKLQATIRALVPEMTSLTQLMKRINSIFYRDSVRSIFASLIYFELLSNDGKIRFVNAGHIPPIIMSNDGLRQSAKSVPALGMLDETAHEEHNIELGSGEILVAYSDGITEARNENGAFFGEEQFFRILKNSLLLMPEKIGERVLHEISIFRGEARVYDDISLVIMKYE